MFLTSNSTISVMRNESAIGHHNSTCVLVDSSACTENFVRSVISLESFLSDRYRFSLDLCGYFQFFIAYIFETFCMLQWCRDKFRIILRRKLLWHVWCQFPLLLTVPLVVMTVQFCHLDCSYLKTTQESPHGYPFKRTTSRP